MLMGLELGNARHARGFGGPALVPVEKWFRWDRANSPCAMATIADREPQKKGSGVF
jgi:hypothetical protein